MSELRTITPGGNSMINIGTPHPPGGSFAHEDSRPGLFKDNEQVNHKMFGKRSRAQDFIDSILCYETLR